MDSDFQSQNEKRMRLFQDGELETAINEGQNLVEEAEQYYADREINKEECSNLAQYNYDLAILYQAAQDMPKAEQYSRRAWQVLENCFDSDSVEIAHILNTLGVILLNQGKLKEAEVQLEKTIEIMQNCSLEDRIEYAEFLSNLGHVYRAKEAYEKANEAYSKALQPKIDTYRKQHPSVAFTMAGLGLLVRF